MLDDASKTRPLWYGIQEVSRAMSLEKKMGISFPALQLLWMGKTGLILGIHLELVRHGKMITSVSATLLCIYRIHYWFLAAVDAPLAT